jgi:hypothetical protein
MEGRPWLFDGNLVSLAEFDGITPPSKMNFDKESFWMRRYNLPLACMSKEVGHKIGSSVGEVEEIDMLEDEAGWGEFLRVKVLMDLSKPIPIGRKLHLPNQSTWVAFKYERLPKFCYKCGVMRHGKAGCLRLGHRQYGKNEEPLISLELFDSRLLNLYLLDLVLVVYITCCCSFCVLSYFQVFIEI